MSPPKEVQYKIWVKQGMMMVRAECLDHDHPMHPYNQIKSQGLNPEDYGMLHPLAEEFKDCSREELLKEISRLREVLNSRERIPV